jgi:hypothetical protein
LIIGTRPITCPGRCAASGPAGRGVIGAARSDPALHIAFYEFDSVEAAEATQTAEGTKALVADFDRVWGDRVPRRREVLEMVQEIAPG